MNMESKLPYIPDKNLYAAVMFACKMIRENGYFNKDVKYAAKYYDVDSDEVAKYVRIAQSNGQKAANLKRPKRKYYWFAIEYSMGNERNGCAYFDPIEAQYTVARGLRADSVTDRLSAHDDYVSEYAPCHWFGRVAQFETENEAWECILQWEKEYKERWNDEQSNISAGRDAGVL